MSINTFVAQSQFELLTKRYSDFKVDLDPHPRTGDAAVSVNAAAVKRAVRSLLFTGKYERRFRPLIGSGLQKYLFEPVATSTAEMIRESIITTLRNHEPRALLVSVRVSVAADLNSYEAVVKFGVRDTPEVVEVKQVLERVR